MLAAAKAWAGALCAGDPRVVEVIVFGSYARGDAGVGSDLDLAILVRDGEGSALFDVSRLPVPADVVVFEQSRWGRLSAQATGIGRAIAREGRSLASRSSS
ncbi:MAG: nucleotidyltransferase domain-containing protein [Betaproteobacteria bacterium]